MRPIDADALLKGKEDHEMISTHLIFNAPTLKVIKVDVLDEIRAEILNFKEKCNASDYLGCGILEIIDKYKAESEDKE